MRRWWIEVLGRAMAKELPIELFMPPNMLKAKVGGSITGMDLSAIKRAETAVDSLKAQFRDWVSVDVAKLNAARDSFAARLDPESREKLYRIAFDITGQAQTFEFPLVARVARSLCDAIAAAPEPADVPMPLVDAYVHAISLVFRENIRSDTNPMALELAKELEARTAELARDIAGAR
jgi:hypothetical protein